MIKRFFKLLIILIISILIGNMAYGMYKEFELNDGPSKIQYANVKQEGENSETNENIVENKIVEKIDEEYEGYKISSKLIIPKIGLNTYVLDKYSPETMDICPTKYFGPNPNELGNYCIAAHNYNKENMFNHIIELEKGDTILLLDNENGEMEYEVYDIYKVRPDETEPLSQKTDGKIELTLITCSDYSSKRIIVKARSKL